MMHAHICVSDERMFDHIVCMGEDDAIFERGAIRPVPYESKMHRMKE